MILRDKSKIRVTCPHFFTAGAVWIDGVGELQNALVRGRQLCTQLPIFEGSLAELLRVLDPSTITFERSLAEFLRFGAQNFYFLRVACRIAWFWTRQLPLLKEVSHNCYLSDGKTN